MAAEAIKGLTLVRGLCPAATSSTPNAPVDPGMGGRGVRVVEQVGCNCVSNLWQRNKRGNQKGGQTGIE